MRAYRTTWDSGRASQDYGTLANNDESAMLRAGRTSSGGYAPNGGYFASAFLPGDQQYIPDMYRNIGTPFGNLEVETNYDSPNTIDATFMPNSNANYYLQALANLLQPQNLRSKGYPSAMETASEYKHY